MLAKPYQNLMERAKTEDIDYISGCAIVPHPEDPNHILLLQRSTLDGQTLQWFWDLPGGKIDTGEEIEEAVRRESQEEAGLKLNTLEYLPTEKPIFFIPEIGQKRLQLFFIAESWEGKIKNFALNDEHIAYQWFDVRSETSLEIVPSRIEGIISYADYIKQPEVQL